MSEVLIVFGTVVFALQAIIGGVLWVTENRWDELCKWNNRQAAYMIGLHGVFVWIGVGIARIHKYIFKKLGEPTKFERAYKNITQ
jgi:hypothetical protein